MSNYANDNETMNADSASSDASSEQPSPKFWPNSDETMILVGQAREGVSEAENHLLERHRDALLRLIDMRLDRRIRSRVDPNDVLQELLITAHKRLHEYLDNPEVPFFLWLRSMAHDRIIDAHRRHRASAKRSVDRERALAFATNDDASTIMLASQLADDAHTPGTEATLREFRTRFEEALESLSDTDREVIIMRHFEHLTNQEVALALELSEHAASMRYVRALRKIGTQLRKDGYAPPDDGG